MKTGTLIAVILLTVVALAHVLRLITQAEVIVDGALIPQWVSVVGVLVPAGIAWMLWRESR